MTIKINKLVLVINLSHIAEESRFVEARNFVNRAINNGTLDEFDLVCVETDDLKDDEAPAWAAKEFTEKKSLE